MSELQSAHKITFQVGAMLFRPTPRTHKYTFHSASHPLRLPLRPKPALGSLPIDNIPNSVEILRLPVLILQTTSHQFIFPTIAHSRQDTH